MAGFIVSSGSIQAERNAAKYNFGRSIQNSFVEAPLAVDSERSGGADFLQYQAVAPIGHWPPLFFELPYLIAIMADECCWRRGWRMGSVI
jgi:hypothetical protein